MTGVYLGMSCRFGVCTIVALSLAAACGGSATAPSAPIVVDEPAAKRTAGPRASLFDRLGGEGGTDRLARAFVARMRTNMKLARPLSRTGPETLDALDANFGTFFCHVAGGGCSDVHMPDSLRALEITEAEWKAAVDDVAGACDEVGLTPEEKSDFLAAITPFHDRIVVTKRKR